MWLLKKSIGNNVTWVEKTGDATHLADFEEPLNTKYVKMVLEEPKSKIFMSAVVIDKHIFTFFKKHAVLKE